MCTDRDSPAYASATGTSRVTTGGGAGFRGAFFFDLSAAFFFGLGLAAGLRFGGFRDFFLAIVVLHARWK
jgi:hypothetical protein